MGIYSGNVLQSVEYIGLIVEEGIRYKVMDISDIDILKYFSNWNSLVQFMYQIVSLHF